MTDEPDPHTLLEEFDVPTWVVGLILVFLVASTAYGIVIRASLSEPIALWIDLFRFLIGLFVVYLLYRLVVAVERIAMKI